MDYSILGFNAGDLTARSAVTKSYLRAVINSKFSPTTQLLATEPPPLPRLPGDLAMPGSADTANFSSSPRKILAVPKLVSSQLRLARDILPLQYSAC